MHLGVESKTILDVMKNLPEPIDIQDRGDVMNAFHSLFYQGEDQAKAAIKGGHALSETLPYDYHVALLVFWLEAFLPLSV